MANEDLFYEYQVEEHWEKGIIRQAPYAFLKASSAKAPISIPHFDILCNKKKEDYKTMVRALLLKFETKPCGEVVCASKFTSRWRDALSDLGEQVQTKLDEKAEEDNEISALVTSKEKAGTSKDKQTK